MKADIFRVAVIGPESSGKTTLCSELASHFNTSWVPEYARDYIACLNHPYTKEDIIHCAKMQLETEEVQEKKATKIFFSDTELIVIKVWLLDRFGECPEWIENKIDENNYDLYLLTLPDIPFVNDPVRENPHRREFFFNWYKTELDERNFRYEVVEGLHQERIRCAINFIHIAMKKKETS